MTHPFAPSALTPGDLVVITKLGPSPGEVCRVVEAAGGGYFYVETDHGSRWIVSARDLVRVAKDG